MVAAVAPSAVAGDGPGGPGSPGAGPDPARVGTSYGNLWNILPPGSNRQRHHARPRHAAPPVAVDGQNAPPNFADQLEMYDALTKRDPDSITQADLEQLYKREDFTPDTW